MSPICISPDSFLRKAGLFEAVCPPQSFAHSSPSFPITTNVGVLGFTVTILGRTKGVPVTGLSGSETI